MTVVRSIAQATRQQTARRLCTHAEVEGNGTEHSHDQQCVTLLLIRAKARATGQHRCVWTAESVSMDDACPEKLQDDVNRLLQLIRHSCRVARCVECLAHDSLVVASVHESVRR